MTREENITKIIEIEWNMFHNVNGDTRADCQDDSTTFHRMRHAQYDVWSDALVESFLGDVTRAEAEGRNLSREKYIRMMESTDPRGYEHFKCELPYVSDEAAALCEEIWAKMLVQTENMRKEYPIIACGGRPLTKEKEANGSTSVETYQKSEMLTYSAETLKLLNGLIDSMSAEGKEYARIVQENSILCMGFKNMKDAEIAMAGQFLAEFGAEIGGGCCCCGG